MTVRKFRFFLSETPSSIQRDASGDTVLKVKVPTKTGKKLLVIRDQEVVRTEDDPIADQALLNYRPPKVPLKHHPGGVPTHAYHNYADHMEKRPFVEVAANTTHHHIL